MSRWLEKVKHHEALSLIIVMKPFTPTTLLTRKRKRTSTTETSHKQPPTGLTFNYYSINYGPNHRNTTSRGTGPDRIRIAGRNKLCPKRKNRLVLNLFDRPRQSLFRSRIAPRASSIPPSPFVKSCQVSQKSFI